MRTAASALLVIVALLLATVAGPALWLQRNVVDQAGFVDLAGPLGSNTAFQGGLSAVAASQATASVDLPPQLEDLAAAVITSSAHNIYTDPGYGQAWTETLQRSHELTFAAGADPGSEGDLQLDIAPLIALIAANVSENIGVALPTPATVVVALDQPQTARLLPLAVTLGGWGGGLAVAAVALLVLGVVAARRRAVALMLSGAGLAVVALVWLFTSGLVESALASLTVGPEVARQLGVELGALARESWQSGITATFVVAAVLAVVGGGALMVTHRRTT